MLGRTRPLREASCAPMANTTTVSNPNGLRRSGTYATFRQLRLQSRRGYIRQLTVSWSHIGGNEDSTLVVYTAHNLLVGHSEGLCCNPSMLSVLTGQSRRTNQEHQLHGHVYTGYRARQLHIPRPTHSVHLSSGQVQGLELRSRTEFTSAPYIGRMPIMVGDMSKVIIQR